MTSLCRSRDVAFSVLLLETFIIGVIARCRGNARNPDILQLAAGKVNYQGESTMDKCVWSFPKTMTNDHVILVKLTDFSLYSKAWGRCTGYFYLTGATSFCTKMEKSCFIYAHQPPCNMETILNVTQNENCTESTWIIGSKRTPDIRLSPTLYVWKDFSFEYRLIPCTEPGGNNSTEGYTAAIEASQSHNSGYSAGTLAGVVVFLLLLLCGSFALIFWMYRRYENLKATPRAPRVQYELAHQQYTGPSQYPYVVQNENADQGEHGYALHGEQPIQYAYAQPYQIGEVDSEYHHNQSADGYYQPENSVMDQQNGGYDVEQRQRAATAMEMSYNYNYGEAGNYGDYDNNDGASFTSDESVDPLSHAAYAKVDKSKSMKV